MGAPEEGCITDVGAVDGADSEGGAGCSALGGTEGAGLGAADGRIGGSGLSDAVDAVLSNGGNNEGIGPTAEEIEEAGNAEAGDAIDADVDGIGWAVAGVGDAGSFDAADTPGGGDATTSGSSISSSGKSGSCSSNGEIGTLSGAVGVVGLADGVGAAAMGTEAFGEGMTAPLAELSPGGSGVAEAFDGPPRVGAAADGASRENVAGVEADGAPAEKGGGAEADGIPVGDVTGAEAAVASAEKRGGAEADGAPEEAGAVLAGDLTGAGALTDAPAAVGGLGGFAAGEVPLTGTPTGFEIFLALWVPVWPAASELDVLRGGAPVETPTVREAPTGVPPDGGDAMLGL